MKTIIVIESKHQPRAGFARAIRWLGLCLLGMLLLFSRVSAQGQTAGEAWVQRFSPGEAVSYDSACKVVVDADGNVIVAGSTGDGNSNFGMLIIKYSGEGLPLWTNRYHGPLSDTATAMALDNNGNVFVTGYSGGFTSYNDFATIAYSGAGVPLWTNRYNGPGNHQDVPTAIAVDDRSNVFVTGYSIGSESVYPDYATIAYSGEGVPLWTNRYNGRYNLEDTAAAVAVDTSGNVFVTGTSRDYDGAEDYVTIAYSESGVALWTNRFDRVGKWDIATALAVDGSGKVFVTGHTWDVGSDDYATIAYSGAGVPLWTNLYNGPDGFYDHATAVAVDGGGNVFVTGFSIGSGLKHEYATVAYSQAGVALWTNRYAGPGNSYARAYAVAVDNGGNVFVTGFSRGSAGKLDYATIAYSGTGVALWTNIYNGPGNSDDGANSVAVDKRGNIFVTGFSVGESGNNDYATVKYAWRAQLAIQPLTTGSSTVNLTLSGAPSSSWWIERAVMISGPWTKLGASMIGPNGLGLFQDSDPPALGGFYRATQP